jgi:hypothetical protein
MDCSSQLALGVGNQVKGVVKTEQDSQQNAQLHPVQQQISRLKTHFPLFGSWSTKGTALCSLGLGEAADFGPQVCADAVITEKSGSREL